MGGKIRTNRSKILKSLQGHSLRGSGMKPSSKRKRVGDAQTSSLWRGVVVGGHPLVRRATLADMHKIGKCDVRRRDEIALSGGAIQRLAPRETPEDGSLMFTHSLRHASKHSESVESRPLIVVKRSVQPRGNARDKHESG
ncbi:hypothetical protein [Paraburkholderia hospita]|uniref:hypothetical protein n=1 Tax=Paraburkholderia hospita TaxID=169430 RepID=UPI0014050521|nr:hypothetical protein [Paraburkholderia hospita]